MRRLGLYIVISILVFSTFGGFSHPEKSFASLTQDDLNRWNSYVDEPNGYLASNNQTPFRAAFHIIANFVFNKYKNDESTTPATAFSYILYGTPDKDKIQIKKNFLYVEYADQTLTGDDYTNITNPTGGLLQVLRIVENGHISFDKPFRDVDMVTVAKRTDSNLLTYVLPAENQNQSYVNKVKESNGDQVKIDQAKSTLDKNLNTLKNASDKNGAARVMEDKAKESECSILPSFTLINCLNTGITWLIKNITLQFAGFFLWLSANLLNKVIEVSILNFSDWATSDLYPIWLVIKQIISLFVVFAGLWLGFMKIIGKDENFNKYIPWVIIFALFVNFSYPISRTLVDVSNMISLNVYSSTIGADALAGNSNDTAGAIIVSKLGLQQLAVSATAVEKSGSDMLGSINSIPGALVAVIYVFYSAYVLFMASAILATRMALLVFLIVGSPLLFVDSVIPKLGEYAIKIRKMYFEQLTVAPVFMIMLALTTKFLTIFQTNKMLDSGSNLVQGASGTGASSSVTVFFNILIMIIMLHIMLKVVKTLSGSVGQAVSGALGTVGGLAMGTALGAATGGTGLLARSTLGRVASQARDSEWVTNNQNNIFGRAAHSITNSVASSSFDARNSSVVRAGAQKLGLGRGMGSGSSETYESETTKRGAALAEKYGKIKTVNEDGSLNLAGVVAKKNLYDGAGKGLFGSEALQKELENKEEQLVGEREARVSKYSSLSGSKRQEYLENNKDLESDLIRQDHVNALAEDKIYNENKERELNEAHKMNEEFDRGRAVQYEEAHKMNQEKDRSMATAYQEAHEEDRRRTAERDQKERELTLAHMEAIEENKERTADKNLPPEYTTNPGGTVIVQNIYNTPFSASVGGSVANDEGRHPTNSGNTGTVI